MMIFKTVAILKKTYDLQTTTETIAPKQALAALTTKGRLLVGS